MTHQPRAIVADLISTQNGTKLDDITTFLGTVPPDEYEQRRRIRTARNAASFKVTQTENPDALALCWIVTETATRWIYAPAPVDLLTEVATYLRRLLLLADQAQLLEVGHG